MLARYVTIPTIVGVAYAFQGFIPGVKNLYWWAFPLMAFIMGCAILVVITAVRLQAKLSLRGTLKRGWELKAEGERLQTRMCYRAERDIDRYDRALDIWSDSVRGWLGGEGSPLDSRFMDDNGIAPAFREQDIDAPGKFLEIHKNYLDRRLTRLQEILLKMSESYMTTPPH